VLPCIHAFLDKERSEAYSPIMFHLDNDEEWEELKETARESNPTMPSQWLRAFYALELTYHTLLPRMFFSASDAQMQKMFLELRAPRSVEGLNQLIALGEKYKRRAAAKRVTLAIGGGRKDNSAQVVDILEQHLQVVGWLLSSAQILKSCLRQDRTSGLTAIGTGLGEAFSYAGESDASVQAQLRKILRITPTNAVTPWNQQISELESYPA